MAGKKPTRKQEVEKLYLEHMNTLPMPNRVLRKLKLTAAQMREELEALDLLISDHEWLHTIYDILEQVHSKKTKKKVKT
jgi:hypothetical protein